jgi:hypothetical protein
MTNKSLRWRGHPSKVQLMGRPAGLSVQGEAEGKLAPVRKREDARDLTKLIVGLLCFSILERQRALSLGTCEGSTSSSRSAEEDR